MKIKQRPKSNLNRETKKKILRLHKQGESLSQISEKLQIRMTHVMDVLKEKDISPNLTNFDKEEQIT